MERDARVLADGNLNEPAVCLYPETHQVQHCHQAREGCPILSVLCGLTSNAGCKVWVPQHEKSIKLLESIQRRAVKVEKDLEGKCVRSSCGPFLCLAQRRGE